ncbi:hypothetical protein DVH05_023477 [Phytophthora capsici]|nr:hypothetical protein DVH05_023477 [Phytophthora capsici]
MKTTGSIMLTAALLLSDSVCTAYYLRGTGIDEDHALDKARVATVQVRYLRKSVEPSFLDSSSTINTSEHHVDNTKAINSSSPVSATKLPDVTLSDLDETERTSTVSPTNVEIGISSGNMVEFMVHPSERSSSVVSDIERRVVPMAGPNRARPTERNFWLGSHYPSRYHMKPQHFFMNRQMDRFPVNLPLILPRARQRQHRYFVGV